MRPRAFSKASNRRRGCRRRPEKPQGAIMSSWKSEAGKGRLGCIVVLALVGVFGFISARVIPVYIDKVEFQESFDRLISRAGAEAMSKKTVEDNVKRVAETYDFEIVPGSLKTTRRTPYASPAKLMVEVQVYRDVHLLGFTHRIQFSTEGTSFIGRL